MVQICSNAQMLTSGCLQLLVVHKLDTKLHLIQAVVMDTDDPGDTIVCIFSSEQADRSLKIEFEGCCFLPLKCVGWVPASRLGKVH
jgi:hypothetical protein